jgi:hypothetical protein
MKVLTKILAGGAGLAALASAAPAAAQYYPGYGYPGTGYGYGGGLEAIIGQLLGGNRYAYGVDQRVLVNQCIAAVTNRIEREFGYARYGAPYGGYGPYGAPYGGYGAYGQVGSNARVLGITSIEPRNSGLRVRGVATANAGMAGYGAAPYGSPYGGYAQPAGELRFKCNINYRGQITDIDLDRNNYAYGYPYGRRY